MAQPQEFGPVPTISPEEEARIKEAQAAHAANTDASRRRDEQSPAWDPNPSYTGDFVNDGWSGNAYTDPNTQGLMGSSWEPTQAQLSKGSDSFWYSNPSNFMYGRTPYAAEQDISRARDMGQNAADMGAAWGEAGANYAQQQAAKTEGISRAALEGGLGMAQGVTDAGQYVNQVGMANAQRQRTVADLQADRGAGLGAGLTSQGAQMGGGIAALGAGASAAGQRYGTQVADVGRSAANVGQAYGSGLQSLSQAGLGAGVGQAQTLSTTGRAYGDQLRGIEAQEGPSGAQALLNQQNNRAMGNQLALARSGRGMGGSAAAIQQAGQNIGALQQDVGNQAAQLRAQENAAWRSRQAANVANAGQLDITARTQALGGTNQAFGQAASAYAAGGALDMQGRQTQLQGATQGAALGMQGRAMGIDANVQGANIAQQGRLAGANLEMGGLQSQAQTLGQAAGMQLQGAQSAADASVNAAGVGQNAYAQSLAGYGQAAGLGMQGFQYGSDTQLAAMQQQQAYEQYAQRIRELEMTGGAQLEDKLTRDYAIATGQQQADRAADAQRNAAYWQAGATGVSALATAFGGG